MVSKRVLGLINKFGKRLDEIPMTVDGIPAEEEINVIRDIWNELTYSEKEAIYDAINTDIARGDKAFKQKLPKPEPYAMRLTFKYLKEMREREKYYLHPI